MSVSVSGSLMASKTIVPELEVTNPEPPLSWDRLLGLDAALEMMPNLLVIINYRAYTFLKVYQALHPV